MANYTKFKVKAHNDHTRFTVLVKGLFGWKSGFVYTTYFSVNYDTEEEALNAIDKYKARFTNA